MAAFLSKTDLPIVIPVSLYYKHYILFHRLGKE